MNTGNLNLVVVGISHKTSELSEREQFQINRKDIPDALNYLKSKNGVEGVLILSTCNRLEFYLVIEKTVNPFLLIGFS